ncbi:hypothetical protein G6F46_015023 [Rhizopus delemar]|nr:hypothetical protein G6F46_015023 [Rhizopus delemar]
MLDQDHSRYVNPVLPGLSQPPQQQCSDQCRRQPPEKAPGALQSKTSGTGRVSEHLHMRPGFQRRKSGWTSPSR